jgi:acyl transferase domain-containing protein
MKRKKVKKNASKDIAIVGMSCRFPGAKNYNEFWENLKNGVNSISEISKDRWDIEKYYSSNLKEEDATYCKWSGLIENHDKFDAAFFNISRPEANRMDPQQRILLEETYHAIEDSGIPLTVLQKENTSVVIGATVMDYSAQVYRPEVGVDAYSSLSTLGCILSNRLSYHFGLKGSSLSIDTACASSLFALHDAFKSLEDSDCKFS